MPNDRAAVSISNLTHRWLEVGALAGPLEPRPDRDAEPALRDGKAVPQFTNGRGGSGDRNLDRRGQENQSAVQSKPQSLGEVELESCRICRSTDAAPSEASELATSHRRDGKPQSLALDSGLRSELEPLFKFDFRNVRIHNDNRGDAVAKKYGARAVTHGPDIYFAAGQYNPNARTGRYLIGHELAHVVQQNPAVGSPSSRNPIERASAAEQEAHAAGMAVAVGRPAAIANVTPVAPALAPFTPYPGDAIGTNPDAPLPNIPAFEVSPRFAQERAEHYTKIGWGREAGIYQSQALGTQDINTNFASFIPSADLAAGALTDHLRLLRKLGFAQSRDLQTGLSAGQKGRVADDLAEHDPEVKQKQGFLANAVKHMLASQELFVGAALHLGAYVSGKAVPKVDEKIAKSQEEMKGLNQKVREAGEFGKRIQSIVKAAASIGTLGGLEHGIDVVEKGAGIGSDLGEAVDDGFLGSILRNMASAKYQGKINELELQIKQLDTLRESILHTQSDQEFDALSTNLKGSFDQLKADVESAALHAKALQDVFRTRPEKPHGQTKPGKHPSAAGGVPKDRAKQVEIITTSAMATSQLLDAAILAAKAPEDFLVKRLGPMMSARPEKADPEDIRYPLGTDEPHGDDVDQVLIMVNYVGRWVDEARKQKDRVQSQAAPAKSSERK